MKDFYTPDELAEIIDEVSANTIRKLGREHKIPSYQVYGKKRFYKEGDVREYIRNSRIEPQRCSEDELKKHRYMHYKDIAALTGMSVSHVRRVFKDADIQVCKFGNVILFRYEDVIAYIEGHFTKNIIN